MTPQHPTSPYDADLRELRAWLEKMVAAMKFVEMIVAVVALIGRMRGINAELTKRVAHLTRKRPRSETLDRLQRQLLLPLFDTAVRPAPAGSSGTGAEKPKRKKTGGTRNPFPAHLERVPVPNPVPDDQRHCPLCGAEMKTGMFSLRRSGVQPTVQRQAGSRSDDIAPS